MLIKKRGKYCVQISFYFGQNKVKLNSPETGLYWGYLVNKQVCGSRGKSWCDGVTKQFSPLVWFTSSPNT